MDLSVDCVCDPIVNDGYHYVQWIGSIFGDCIYTPLEKFSYYAGIISIIFYFIAFYPQIYENYKRKSTDGLSLALIIIWFFGDFANYIGTILTEQYPIQKVVGVYFALMEVIIIGQYIYYKFIYKGPTVIDEEEEEGEGEGEEGGEREPNEYDQLIVKAEDNKSDTNSHHNSFQQHTYETFSDIPRTSIQPPLDPNEAIEEIPKINFNNSSLSSDPTATNENNNMGSSISSSVISKSSRRSMGNEEVMISESQAKPQEQVPPETKYETFAEINQKQQQQQQQQQKQKQEISETSKSKDTTTETSEATKTKETTETTTETTDATAEIQEPFGIPEVVPIVPEVIKISEVPKEEEDEPVQETSAIDITSNLDKNSTSFSTSISNSISKANMRNIKSSNDDEHEESSSKKENEDKEENEENDNEDSKEPSEDIYDSSKDISSLSLDTKDGEDDDDEDEEEIENESSFNRSESSLNKKKKKKGRKGKKKKGKKAKKAKGLSTAIQTLALLSLFILQVHARVINWPEGYTGLLENDQTSNDPIRLCDERPKLTMAQKILGSFMAWGSGILYFTSRIPQIVENHKNRSVEGLSVLLFICTILGNLFYGLSILTRFPPIDEKFFAGTLPYLIGSVGTFIFDIMIIYQFNAYQNRYERL